MSTTRPSALARTVESCRPADATPVTIDAAKLESTAPDHLRELKRELGERALVPAALAVEASFQDDCSLATQAEADRLREYVRAAAFLGAATVRVTVESVVDGSNAESALRACAERAAREGVVLDVDGPVSLD